MDDRRPPAAPQEPGAPRAHHPASRAVAGRGIPATSSLAADGRPDEVRATARLLVDVVHSVAAPPAGAEAAHGSVHGSAGARIRLSPQAVRAAVSIYEHERLTIGGLAGAIGVSVGWASRIVEELEECRYVERERDPEDRRVVWVQLSPEAIADVEGSYRWRDDAVRRALAGLSAAERVGVRRFLASLVDVLATEQAEAAASADAATGSAGAEGV